MKSKKRESAPSRAQRVASKGDIFYQTVRPYQKNNYLFDKDDTNYVFSTGYAQLRTTIHGGYFFTHGLHELQKIVFELFNYRTSGSEIESRDNIRTSGTEI